jgi:hypothetical protein
MVRFPGFDVVRLFVVRKCACQQVIATDMIIVECMLTVMKVSVEPV